MTTSEDKAKIRRKRWNDKNPEQVKRIWREGAVKWRKRNRLRSLFISAKARAKKKKIPFNIELEDLGTSIPEVCPVLNISLTSPSVDRINNSKGYTKGNVRIISKRANLLKNNMTKEECKLLLKDLECHL